jgi:uncharacterized membrane protein
MGKGRLEAFSDGVIAIIITIMVLELKVPKGFDLIALRPIVPVFLCYVLSYIFVGIYWNNHHHLLHATKKVSGGVLWANLHLLFWLSLFPAATDWLGRNLSSPWPTALYGIVLLMGGVSYAILVRVIIRQEGKDSTLREIVGRDFKGLASLVLYALGIALAFFHTWASEGLYVIVALMWLVPDRRIEKRLHKEN